MGSIDDFSRYSFPDDFVFGTSSSAYQVHALNFAASSAVIRTAEHCLQLLFIMIYSMKVKQTNMVEDQLYGTLSLRNMQVRTSLSLSIKLYFNDPR